MANGPLTATELDTIRTRHAEGKSLRSIAVELGRAPTTIGTHAKRMGLSWDAGRTAAATEAKQASNRERRARLIARLYDRADKIMDRLEADQFKYVGEFEGRAIITRLDADAIPGKEERALGGMVVNMLAGAARLEAVDQGTSGAEKAKGILGAFAVDLQAAYGQLSHTGSSPTAQAVLAETDETPDQ